MQKVCESYGFALKKLSDEAKKALLEYPWPGNIRELLSVIERATILSEGDEIGEKDLCLSARNEVIFGKKENKMENLEKELIVEVLKECDGDINRASAMLGMSADVLKSKRARYGV